MSDMDFFQAISQLGFPIAIAAFLLWDYSKKLTAMQIELVKITEKISSGCESYEEIIRKLEKMEEAIYANGARN